MDTISANQSQPQPQAIPTPPTIRTPSNSPMNGGEPPHPIPLSTPQPPKRGHKGLIAAIIALVIILVLAGGAAAYYFLVYDQSPERVVQKSMLAMSELTSISYSARVETSGSAPADKITFPPAELMPGSIQNEPKARRDFTATLNAEGSTTLTGAANAKITFRLNAQSGDQSLLGPLSAEVRQLDDVTYFNLSEINLPEEIMAFVGPYTDMFENRWIEVNKERILDTLKISDIIEKIETEQKEQTEEFEAKYEEPINEAVREYLPQLFTVTATLPNEVIDGAETHHYAYVVNKEKLKELSERIKEILAEDLDTKTEKQITEMGNALDRFDEIKGEIWIGKQNSYLYRLTASGKPNDDNQDSDVTLTADIKLSDFNKPVTIAVPENSATIEEITTEIIAKITTDAEKQRSDEDNDGLTLAEEERYGTDPSKADSDGDTFTDGVEVEGGYNPLGEGLLVEPKD